MDFQNKLKELMVERNMKAVDLARATGLSEAAISDYLKGKKEPRGRQSIAIAKALNVSLDTLWDTGFQERPSDCMTTMDMRDIIFLRRKELGLTLEEVGNAVGVGKSTVRKWETGGIGSMRRDKIALLAKVLQVSPAYLMGWEDDIDAKKSPSMEEGEKNIAKEIIEGLQKGKAMIAGKGKDGIDTIPVSNEEFKVIKNMLEAMRKARDMDKD